MPDRRKATMQNGDDYIRRLSKTAAQKRLLRAAERKEAQSKAEAARRAESAQRKEPVRQ